MSKRPEEGEGVSHTFFWETSIPGRGTTRATVLRLEYTYYVYGARVSKID